MDLIFKIAGIGILVAIVNQVLVKSGRDDYATMTTIVGIVIVLAMVARQIYNLFDTVKTLFQF